MIHNLLKKPLQRGMQDLYITDTNGTKWLFHLDIEDNKCQVSVFYFLNCGRITTPLLDQEQKFTCQPYERDVLEVINRFMVSPLKRLIFDKKDLQVGKTYKGLVNGLGFKVLEKKIRTSYWGQNRKIEEEVFVIQDESGNIFETGTDGRLYTQEVN